MFKIPYDLLLKRKEKKRKEKKRKEKKRKEKKRKEKKRKEKKRKEKKRKEKKTYAFRHQFNEKPSTMGAAQAAQLLLIKQLPHGNDHTRHSLLPTWSKRASQHLQAAPW